MADELKLAGYLQYHPNEPRAEFSFIALTQGDKVAGWTEKPVYLRTPSEPAVIDERVEQALNKAKDALDEALKPSPVSRKLVLEAYSALLRALAALSTKAVEVEDHE